MHNIFFDISIVIVSCAVLAWLANLSKQPIIIGYIAAGILLGPSVLNLIKEVRFIDEVSHIGISLLLFLAGLVLHPKMLKGMFRKTLLITCGSGIVFSGAVTGFALLFGFSIAESIISGLALMFSSTILVIKLFPTITLHQKYMGQLAISILITQDILAVILLLGIKAMEQGSIFSVIQIPIIGAGFIAGVLLIEKFVLRWIMKKAELYHELLFLLALAWCFGCAVIAKKIGLSHEIGAFAAGISIARSPIAYFISQGLQFFRDFFLVLFFFVLGAKIDFLSAKNSLLPSLLLGTFLLIIKPLIYMALFRLSKEKPKLCRELGIRLGQASEFALIVALLAFNSGVIGLRASQFIQFCTIFTMVISCYLTIFIFPSPLGTKQDLKQD